MDQPLIAAAQAGSDTAFEKLHARHARAIYRVALSITKNHADAEDAAQDAFLRAYLSLGNLREQAQFYSWLTRIVINSSLMLLRRRRTQRELSMEGMSEPGGNAITIDVIDSRPNPERFFDLKQIQVDLEQSIKKLPYHLRVVAEMRLLRETSIDETKRVLGVSDAAIKSRLFRARKRIAKMRGVEYPPGHRSA
jgi:RNA polymerase sigma-70 factor (ECF subfamily)